MAIRYRFLALLAFFLIPLALAACGESAPVCRERGDDPDGYLLAICEYVVAEEIDVSPGKPDAYNIVRVEDTVYDGKEVVLVYLDCCHMGDTAIIDRATGAVLAFRLGPK